MKFRLVEATQYDFEANGFTNLENDLWFKQIDEYKGYTLWEERWPKKRFPYYNFYYFIKLPEELNAGYQIKLSNVEDFKDTVERSIEYWKEKNSSINKDPFKYKGRRAYHFIVYKLDDEGDEEESLKSFIDDKRAIKFAQQQPFSTHVVIVPFMDPDDDPDFEDWFRDNVSYEPYEVVWESNN